jgi:hypothetical protein
MKKKLFVTLIGLVLFCSSCSLMLLKYAGIKPAKAIAIEKVYRLAQKNNIPKAHITFIKPGYQNYINAVRLGVPGAYLFNNSGKFLHFKDVNNGGCIGGLPVILAQLNPNKSYELSNDYTYDQIASIMVDTNGQNISVAADLAENDFIFICTFSSFYQKASEENRSWEEAIKANKTAKIKYYHLTTDALTQWNPLIIDSLKKEGYLNYKWYNVGIKTNPIN